MSVNQNGGERFELKKAGEEDSTLEAGPAGPLGEGVGLAAGLAHGNGLFGGVVGRAGQCSSLLHPPHPRDQLTEGSSQGPRLETGGHPLESMLPSLLVLLTLSPFDLRNAFGI